MTRRRAALGAAAAALVLTVGGCGGTDGGSGGDGDGGTGGAAGGPLPTGPLERDESAENGPLEVRTEELGAEDVHGFGGGTLHYPARGGSYAVVAAAPGLGADESMVAWYGEVLASHGFVTLTMNTDTVNDSPDQRGAQILDALDHIVEDSAAADRADGRRLGVLGHSMGGGGALAAAHERSAVRAAVALTPYYEGEIEDWSRVEAAALVIGGEGDEIAPVSDHAEPLHDGLDGARERAYLALRGDHFVTNTPSRIVTEQVVGWLQRFLSQPPAGGGESDHRGALCPAPEPDDAEVVESRDSCPHRGAGDD
ncbi:dienelactone hydrolase family protein [Streptomyces sp. XM4193]|uniref:poly(ethylene terephthalate) hydrolase family protein n=1 Tax=Streptomyces sp. XM4193 TaxID=2929782 RepID=UPI001FFB1CCF|nr:dienelactone hydrolase family protein [Streptomyces sp. XM4193]MCK1794855.1 dienelactone hydrolase family protein [Streptomyces sp. XM4193]